MSKLKIDDSGRVCGVSFLNKLLNLLITGQNQANGYLISGLNCLGFVGRWYRDAFFCSSVKCDPIQNIHGEVFLFSSFHNVETCICCDQEILTSILTINLNNC